MEEVLVASLVIGALWWVLALSWWPYHLTGVLAVRGPLSTAELADLSPWWVGRMGLKMALRMRARERRIAEVEYNAPEMGDDPDDGVVWSVTVPGTGGRLP